MRKLGLRTLAGGLAVLMTVSVLGPATPARAENDLLIAPAPTAVNTLYVTKDMVDSDNEIIISGENWDRIVVTKEAAAANIYFDEVEVGELVIESGSDSTIQLWKVDAGKVTVQEPELKEIDMTGLRVLLAEQETRQQAIDYFMRVQAENEQILRSAPLVMTMEDASVETVSAGANVRLDLHEGEVKALNVEASDKLDRMDVTLEGYKGDVTYAGNKGFSIVNLKNVDSRIGKLTVADSSADNYLNVTSRDSVALSVEVAGDAKVSLNIPTGELDITEAAKAASVDVLNAVDNMNVSGSNAKVEIAPIGNVAKASITGDKAEIGGAGTLGEAVILGKEVYVSTKGTDIEGENSYVEPVYEAPKVVVKNTYDNMTAGATTLTKNGNGTATVSFSGQYQSATFNVPANVDVDRIRSITVEVTTGAQFGISILTRGGEAVVSEYPGYGISEPTRKELTYSVNPAEQKIAKISLMSLNASQPDLTLESVTFNLYEEGKAPTPKPTPLPDAPSDLGLPAGSREYQFADLLPCEGWGNTVSTDAPHGGVKAAYERQYACTKFVLPEALTLGDFEKVILTASSGTGPLGIELYDAEDNKLGFWWNKKVTATTDLQLTYNTTGYGGGESISAENLAKQVAKVNVMYHGDGDGAEVVLYRVAFVAKPGAGGDTPTPGVTGTPEPTPGVTEGTQCTTDRYAVHTFTGYDLRDYAGTTVEISVDMRKTGGDATVAAHVQLNDSGYTGIAWSQQIKDEWTNFSYTYEVPAAFADQANPVYFGFRTVNDVDYSAYTFYYKDFTFEGTLAGGDTPTTTPGVTVTPEPTPEQSASVKITAPAKATLTIGESLQLEANVTPAGGEITWSSSDSAVATVDATGKVSTVSDGAVTITAACGEAKDEVELTVEKAFYLKNEEAFEETVGSNNSAAILSNYYMDGTNFSGKLPEPLKAVLAEKVTTMAGIVSCIESIEFSITLTQGTVKPEGNAAYEPQAELVVQGNGKTGNYDEATYKNKCLGIGEPGAGTKTGTTKFYFATQTFGEASGETVEWTDVALGQIGISIKNAAADSTVAGTYTIKVILK